MFWTVLMLTGLALVFIKLGEISVWASVLSGSLHFAVLVIACLAIALFWKKVISRES
jgi:hypothetical protein